MGVWAVSRSRQARTKVSFCKGAFMRRIVAGGLADGLSGRGREWRRASDSARVAARAAERQQREVSAALL